MRFEEFAATRLPAVLRFVGVLTADHAGQYAERDALLAELGKLPRRQRAVLVLRYYEGLSDAEIADVGP